jgi:hypothetical protein
LSRAGTLALLVALAILAETGHAQSPVPPLIDPSNLELLFYRPPDPFVGPEPLLLQGTPPITWSFVNGPEGMTIDPSTGVLTWTYPDPEAGDLFITLIASNAAGMDEMEVFIEQAVTAALPLNPIEERTIHIAPQSASSSGRPPATTGAVLTPPPGSDYSSIRLEFLGYVEVDETAPQALAVTLRAAGLYDRAGEGGQSFPAQSGAVFVVETKGAGGSPFTFADPVNMSVPHVGRELAHETDIVTFDSTVGQGIDMRICEDHHPGFGADFVFIDLLQVVDASAEMVHVSGITTLTDSQGVGVWGAVVNPFVPTPSELADHVLSRAPIVGPNRPAADRNGDGAIDAADLVTLLNR